MFRKFIISLIKRGNISEKWCEKLTDEVAMESFKIAFTHKSYNEDVNYELAELLGDVTVNKCVMNYLRKWNPDIVSVKYLTRLKHNITSKKELGLMAEKAGFFEHILIGDELREQLKEMDETYKHRNEEYMSLLEDCFEAFIGTLEQIADDKSNSEGFGFAVCYRVIKSFLVEIKISLNYKDVFDAKTRYKELCDKRAWDFGTAMKTRDLFYDENGVEIRKLSVDRNGNPNSNRKFQVREAFFNDKQQEVVPEKIIKRYEVTVVGYPYGSKKKDVENMAVLGKATLPIKVDAQNSAAEDALTILKDDYDIYDPLPDPYKRKN